MLIDTHAHLNFSAFKNDCDEVIKRTLQANTWIINVGSQSTTSERAVEIAEKYAEGVYAAVGLHPTHLFEMEVDEEEIYPVKSAEGRAPKEQFNRVEFKSRCEKWNANFYEKLAKNKKVVAVGEVGLDYHFAPKDADLESVKKCQQEVFRLALDSADKLNLPVIIHSRDTHADLVPILKEYAGAGKLKRRGVLHCFTGSWEEAKKYLDLGFLISFTGIITFAPRPKQIEIQKRLLEVVEKIPLDLCMVETDAPYLAPEPYRGKRNEPAYVEFVARKIAEVKNLTFQEVAKTTTQTAKNFFKI